MRQCQRLTILSGCPAHAKEIGDPRLTHRGPRVDLRPENQTKLMKLIKELENKIEAELAKGQTPDLEDVKEYLERMHIKEVALKKTGNASGPQTTVEDVPEQEWSILDENKTIDRSRRVLVPGAPMRAANPYLVSPR